MFQIYTTGPEGTPKAEIPSQYLWDIVEFLSCQRLDVSYSYQESSFTVSFNRLDSARASQILQDWEHSHMALAS